MIDKTIFEFMLSKLNDETINTQGVSFRGNYVFVRINDIGSMLDTSTYNAYDTEDTYFTAVAETLSQETPYVEDNNRSGWIKRYAFEFDIKDVDENLAALQELRDYFKENDIQVITDDSTNYKMALKVSRPMFIANRQGAGTVFTSYYMDFFADTIGTGRFGNEATHQMKTSVTTEYNDIIVDQVTISSSVATNPSNKLTSNVNTDNQPVARGVTFNFVINYDGSTLNKTILGIIEGTGSRETTFDYKKVFDGVTTEYEILITGGSVVYKKGVVIQLRFNGVETNVV